MLGLIFAGLFDRVRRESLAKTIVFLPLAISLVGASVIWQFVYAWQPEGQTQIGLLNAIVVGLGGEPIPWLTSNPLNIFCEIVILVWLQTGFAMVVFSASIKGVSGEVLEAARLDGANERQLFVRVIVPMIRGSIITVSTTIAIVTLKIFDIVYVTNGGRFGDDVVANQMFLQLFQFFDDGRRRRARDRALHRRPARDVHQPAQLQTTRGGRMTAPAQPIERPSGTRAAWRPAFIRSVPLRLSVLVICFLWTVPTLGLLVTSVRDPALITTSGWWTSLLHPFEANQWTLSNYQTVLASDGMGNAFINSLIVTIPSVAIPITIAAFAAYAFAWIPFRGRGILFTIVVALLVVPIQMSLIPILQIYAAGNLYGSFLGIWLAHTGFGLPLAIFLLYNFMSQLPRDLFESAAIDGASALQTFIRLVLPLSIPALGAIAIFQFLWVWNDLLVALVFLGPGADVRVLPTALYNLIGSRGGSWHLLTAGAFITMIVPLLVFLLLQRAFVRGILAGSVKS